MKIRNIIYTLCFFGMTVFMVLSCEKKDPIEPVTPPEKEMSLEVTASPKVLDSPGLTSMISIKVLNADSTISNLPGVNFKSGSFNISVETPKLDATTMYQFKSYSNGKFVNVDVLVYVNKPLPTLTLTPSVGTLPIGGGEVTINIVTTSADSVFSFFDGKKLLPNCNETYIIDTTTFFTYEAYGPGGKIKKDIIVVVEEPITIAQLLCLAPWQMVKLEFKHPDGDWFEGNIGCQLDDIFTFYFDPQEAFIDFGEIKCESEPDSISGPWIIDGNLICTGDPRGIWFEIIDISKDSLIWIYCFSDGACTKETYAHP